MPRTWLINDVETVKPKDRAQIERALARRRRALAPAEPAWIALLLKDATILDNRSWWPNADVRFDTVVTHAGGTPKEPSSFISAETHRFDRVADGTSVLSGDESIRLFYGQPRHFLDFSVIVSRDRKRSDDLMEMIEGAMGDKEMTDAISLITTAVISPGAAAVIAAMKAGTKIAGLCYKLLKNRETRTIGYYHASFLEHRDKFGVGRHPPGKKPYQKKDLQFSYQIVRERA